MLDGLLKNISLGVVRHLVTAIGGSLVADGYITADQNNSLLGSALFLAGLSWSIWEKYKTHKPA